MYTIDKFKIALLTLFFVFYSGLSQNKKFKVTLDAGHGGKDWGATYNGHVEKNIALAVTLKVGEILESQPDIEVNYTRKTDVFIELVERANIANRVDANIFVSMHCNANKNAVADGTETYVMGMTKNASNLAVAKSENSVITLEKDYKQKYEGYDPNSPDTFIGMTLMQEEFLENSIDLASKIQDRFTLGLGKKNRGVRQAPYMVLHKAYMPRVLIEMGFISNHKEGAILDSEEGQTEIAKAIADAIINYKKDNFSPNVSIDEDVKPSQKMNDVKEVVKTAKTETKKNVDSSKLEVKNNTKTVAKQNEEIIYKVQISASNKKLDLHPRNFKGLKPISISSDSTSFYKYFYGETNDLEEAKKYLKEAKSKGYNSAYIIALKNGKLVSLKDINK